ncbi:MAG: HEAT repeat domain-containing protein [Planctomycetaceae bacterium]
MKPLFVSLTLALAAAVTGPAWALDHYAAPPLGGTVIYHPAPLPEAGPIGHHAIGGPIGCMPKIIERPCEFDTFLYQRKPSDLDEPCELPAPPPCAPGCYNKRCELAGLFYTVMTDCHAKHRRHAVDDIGDEYNCRCNPEILLALVYALNDTDHAVRREAADSLGDQMDDNRCCCCKEIVLALKCALGDCDPGVRKQAEEALEACGYCIVDGCCIEEPDCPVYAPYDAVHGPAGPLPPEVIAPQPPPAIDAAPPMPPGDLPPDMAGRLLMSPPGPMIMEPARSAERQSPIDSLLRWLR